MSNWLNLASVDIRANCCLLLGILNSIIQTFRVELLYLHATFTTLMSSVDLLNIFTWIFSVISVKLFYSVDDFCSIIWIDKFTSHLMGNMFRTCWLNLMLNIGGILIALSALLRMRLWRKFVNLAQIHWKLVWGSSLLWLFMSINGMINITEVISVLSMLRCANFYYSCSLICLRRVWFHIASTLTYCAYLISIWINRVCAGLVGMMLVS